MREDWNKNFSEIVGKHYKGFTILEILVVLAVLAILIAIAVPRIKGMQDQAGITRAKSELKALQAALEGNKLTYGQYADHLSLLYLPGTNPKLISAGNEIDPWNHRYRILRPGGDSAYYFMYSHGPTLTDANGGWCYVGLDTPTGTPYERAGCQHLFVTNAPVASMTLEQR